MKSASRMFFWDRAGKRKLWRWCPRFTKTTRNDLEAAAIHASLLAKGNPQQLQSAIDELEPLAAKEPGNALLQYHLGRIYSVKADPASFNKARQVSFVP